MIKPAQIRAARHLLGISQDYLSQITGLSVPTIRRAESERNVPISEEAMEVCERALTILGADFINTTKRVGVTVSR